VMAPRVAPRLARLPRKGGRAAARRIWGPFAILRPRAARRLRAVPKAVLLRRRG
jgi:hypothetical protein